MVQIEPKKIDFLAIFKRFSGYGFLRPMSYARILGQMKGLMEIHNPGKFHQYSICGCQVMYFQRFS